MQRMRPIRRNGGEFIEYSINACLAVEQMISDSCLFVILGKAYVALSDCAPSFYISCNEL